MGLGRPDAANIVVFGASGDLTSRKVMPALYNLFVQDLLPEDFCIVGYARTPMEEGAFIDMMRDAVGANSRCELEDDPWAEFSSKLRYVSGDYADADGLAELIPKLDAGRKTLLYCATPPSLFPVIAGGLGALGLTKACRIVIEKPFGRDLDSAKELNKVLHEHFAEEQIFRIDHYLGKETVQNILVFRFANGMFEPIWNRRYVASVQLDVAEDLGIGNRGPFYEEAGAVRDIVQNHLMQLLAILTMEPPSSFDAESIRNEKVKVLKAVPPIEPADVVRGQYAAGVIGAEPVAAYRNEQGVAPDSEVATFMAAKLSIENWRWAGVPFYLRTGKRLRRRATSITVVFREAPHMLFRESGIERPKPNSLTIRVQPDEGISLTFDAKVPGPEMVVAPVDMDFHYEKSFMTEPSEAYERLIHDAMLGDPTLFARADEIERAWEIVGGILDSAPPDLYAAGTWGPREADRLVAPDSWHLS